MTDSKLFKTDYLPVTEEIVTLPPVKCDEVMLFATSITKDDLRIQPNANGSFKNLGNDIIWGVGGVLVNQLFVTEYSIKIGVKKASEIQFKCAVPTANQLLAVSYFEYLTEDK